MSALFKGVLRNLLVSAFLWQSVKAISRACTYTAFDYVFFMRLADTWLSLAVGKQSTESAWATIFNNIVCIRPRDYNDKSMTQALAALELNLFSYSNKKKRASAVTCISLNCQIFFCSLTLTESTWSALTIREIRIVVFLNNYKDGLSSERPENVYSVLADGVNLLKLLRLLFM